MKIFLITTTAVACMAAVAVQAQIAPGFYVGSVQRNNLCSNGGHGFDAQPAHLLVSASGQLNYALTGVYAAGKTQAGVPISQGGISILKVDSTGNWTSQTASYIAGVSNGYSTNSGTWIQTFTTDPQTGVVTATGTFDIVNNGVVVCSEPTDSTFLHVAVGQ